MIYTMDTFFYSLNAILPILLIILAGYLAGRFGRFSRDFYGQLNSFCFRYLLPVQIFINVYAVEDLADINWRMIAFLVASVFFCLFIGLLATCSFPADHGQRAVIVQASFRSNQAIVGLPLATALGGAAAVGFTSLIIAFCVPLYVTLGIIVLSLGGRDKERRFFLGDFLRSIITDSLVLSGLLGFAVVFIRQYLPQVDGEPVFMIKNQLYPVYEALSKVSAVASPTMLFALGARFEFKAVKKLLPGIALGTVLRLIVCPILILICAFIFKDKLMLTVVEIPAFIALSTTPASVTGAAMAQELNCDGQLASQIVVWTSILSPLTIFCFICCLRAVGML